MIEECSLNCCISFGVHFSDLRAKIGEHVYIGADCDIGWADIGNDTLIGSGVHIISGKHTHGIADLNIPIRLQPGTAEMILIGENCWIGNGAIIMAKIGNHSVVGAGSVVIKDLPDFSVVVGNPAKIIRKRNEFSSKE